MGERTANPNAVVPEPEQVPMEEVQADESDAYCRSVSMAQLKESVQSMFKINPYIPNRWVDQRNNLRFHVDDLMGNQADPKVKVTRGNVGRITESWSIQD
jgi:hypothetical protein